MSESKPQLENLMKAKYGVNEIKLTFKEGISLKGKYQKLADAIGKSIASTPEDLLAAAKYRALQRMVDREEEIVEIRQIMQADYDTIDDYTPYASLFPLNKNQVFRVVIEGEDSQKLLILDTTNRAPKHEEEGRYFKTKNFITHITARANRSIGYAKIYQDLAHDLEERGVDQAMKAKVLSAFMSMTQKHSYMTEFDPSKTVFGTLDDDYLNQLPTYDETIHPDLWDLRRSDTIFYTDHDDETPLYDEANGLIIYPSDIPLARKRNQIVDLLDNYITSTYNITLQSEHQKNVNKTLRARVWDTKKHVNKSTQAIMDKTKLLQDFRYVELDNDVDLDAFHEFEHEAARLMQVLPKIGAIVPELRLRKLGNYKALGLFVVDTNAIAVDFRSRDSHESINGVGIQSFVHEYGHYLDYNSSDGPLSLTAEFAPILSRYQDEVKRTSMGLALPKGSGIGSLTYYMTPTEVFARGFEVYVQALGLDTPLRHTDLFYENSFAHTAFDEIGRKQLFAYMAKHFPDLEKNITELVAKEGAKEASVIAQVPDRGSSMAFFIRDKYRDSYVSSGNEITISTQDNIKRAKRFTSLLEVKDFVRNELKVELVAYDELNNDLAQSKLNQFVIEESLGQTPDFPLELVLVDSLFDKVNQIVSDKDQDKMTAKDLVRQLQFEFHDYNAKLLGCEKPQPFDDFESLAQTVFDKRTIGDLKPWQDFKTDDGSYDINEAWQCFVDDLWDAKYRLSHEHGYGDYIAPYTDAYNAFVYADGLDPFKKKTTSEAGVHVQYNTSATSFFERQFNAYIKQEEAHKAMSDVPEIDDTLQALANARDYKGVESHLKETIKNYLDADKFKRFLIFAAHNKNQPQDGIRLILDQRPDATRVSNLGIWKFVGRHVKDESASFYAYHPNLNGDHGGKCRLVPSFDISQTEGAPLKNLGYGPDNKTQQDMYNLFEALQEVSRPCYLHISRYMDPKDCIDQSFQIWSRGKDISIQPGLGPEATISAAVHALAYVKMATHPNYADNKTHLEAQALRYILATRLGLDTSQCDLTYLTNWTQDGNSLEDFEASLKRITEASKFLINHLDKEMVRFNQVTPKNKFEERLAQGKQAQSVRQVKPKQQEKTRDFAPKK